MVANEKLNAGNNVGNQDNVVTLNRCQRRVLRIRKRMIVEFVSVWKRHLKNWKWRREQDDQIFMH